MKSIWGTSRSLNPVVASPVVTSSASEISSWRVRIERSPRLGWIRIKISLYFSSLSFYFALHRSDFCFCSITKPNSLFQPTPNLNLFSSKRFYVNNYLCKKKLWTLKEYFSRTICIFILSNLNFYFELKIVLHSELT